MGNNTNRQGPHEGVRPPLALQQQLQAAQAETKRLKDTQPIGIDERIYQDAKDALAAAQEQVRAKDAECRGLQFDRDQFGRELKACRDDREATCEQLAASQREVARLSNEVQLFDETLVHSTRERERLQTSLDEARRLLVEFVSAGTKTEMENCMRDTAAFLAAQPQDGGGE